MEWIKASIETTSIGTDIVTALLMDYGISGVEIIDAYDRIRFFKESTRTWDYADDSLLVANSDFAYVIFYVTSNDAGKGILHAVNSALLLLAKESFSNEVGSLTLQTEFANDETWLNEWKKHFKPLRVGRIVIVPEWDEFKPEHENDIIFTIDPGSAFGTGQHQTTQLCINALQKWMNTDDAVLDIGCGSGILSIISLLLGASFVYAIDVDPAGAIAATKKNAQLNPIRSECLKISSGDILTNAAARKDIGNNRYNIVVANIVADVIIPLAPLISQFSDKNGFFIASGIITERLDSVLDAFKAEGIFVLEINELEGWHSVVGKVNA